LQVRKDPVPSDDSYDAGASSDGGEVIVIEPDFAESKAISTGNHGPKHVLGDLDADDDSDEMMMVNASTSSMLIPKKLNEADECVATSLGSPGYRVEVFE